jgi:O-methyltransferase
MIIRTSNKLIRPFGFQLQRPIEPPVKDMTSDGSFMELYNQCRPFTMTSIERMFSLYQALQYIVDNDLPGDMTECGVWKGGSSMMIALYLKSRGITDRKIWMYDTYEGMSAPTEADKSHTGESAEELLKVQDKQDDNSIWCYSSLDDVKNNLVSTGYPLHHINFIKGKVEDTLLTQIPGQLSLLRLDTDWYESTKMEMNVLYHLLISKGVLIIDDYGHWEGAKKAVNEYFEQHSIKPLLHRIDVTGRIMVKV